MAAQISEVFSCSATTSAAPHKTSEIVEGGSDRPANHLPQIPSFYPKPIAHPIHSNQKISIALTREKVQKAGGQRAKRQDSKELQSLRNLAHYAETEIVVAVTGIEVVATRRATKPRRVVPGAAA